MSKKVLFIAYHFPPIGGSGVQRSIKHVKYLPEFGYEPIVVTVKSGHNFAYDYSLLDEIPENTKIYRSNSGETLWFRKIIENTNTTLVKIKSKIKRESSSKKDDNNTLVESQDGKETIKDKVFRYLEYNYYIPDTKIRWYKHAIRDINERVLKENNINIIYSTSSPYTDHLIALEVKKKTKLPWVADFRDPWIGNDTIMDRYPDKRINKEKEMEREIITLADKVINVTEPITEMYKKRYPEFESKFVTITNGFDRYDTESVEVDSVDKFIISYAGVLGGGRTPESLIRAAEEIAIENENFRKDLVIDFTGYVDEIYNSIFNNSSIKDNITINPYVQHKEAVKLMKEASINVLILPDSEESKGVYTGKIFDYIMAQKPILGIMPKDGIAATLINGNNIGKAANHKDIQEIKKFIMTIYERFKRGESLENDGINKCSQFDRINLSRQLSILLDEAHNKYN